MTKLNQIGRIPAFTECPYTGRCPIWAEGQCHHKGVKHPFEFSCATARWFDMEEKYGEYQDLMTCQKAKYPADGNQCDGCLAEKPLNPFGHHVMNDKRDDA